MKNHDFADHPESIDPVQHFKTAHALELQIEHDQCRRVGTDHRHDVDATRSDMNRFIAQGLQNHSDGTDNHRVIVDDQC